MRGASSPRNPRPRVETAYCCTTRISPGNSRALKVCSGILQAKGYRVRRNVYLRKPRAQVDVFGISDGISVAVDCKHWARAPGYSSLARQVEAQKVRAARLHESLDRIGPIASVILVLVDQGARFVSGGAIVPVFAFGDFLGNVETYRDQLDLV